MKEENPGFGESVNLKLFQSQESLDVVFSQMARQICSYGMEDLCFITILKGGLYTAYKIFFNLPFLKLTSHQSIDAVFGYIGISAYQEGTKVLNEVHVVSPLDLPKKFVNGKNVWILDDCIDSGSTLRYVKMLLEEFYAPKSLHTAVLVDKVKNREKCALFPKPTVVGISYEGDGFLVGTGMGFGERFRGYHSLYELEDKDV